MINIPSSLFQIPYSENVFLNESFIPASGNLFFCLVETVSFCSELFFLMLETTIEIMGN